MAMEENSKNSLNIFHIIIFSIWILQFYEIYHPPLMY